MPETTGPRYRAAAVLVACGVVLVVLLLSPVSLRGERADLVAVAVVSLIGAAAGHEVSSRAFRYVVIYPLCLLAPTVAACSTAFVTDQQSVLAGHGCRVQLEHEGWVASAWVNVEVLKAINWTPFEIIQATGRIQDVDVLGGTAPGGGWEPFGLSDLIVRRSNQNGCVPSFAYGEQSLPVAWVTGHRAR